MREFTPAQAEDLYELICERCRTGSIITTSNRSPADWYPLFPNAVLAESALDRLVNSAHHVLFRGRTYRPLRRPDGGGAASLDDAEDLDHPQPGRALQTRAAESAHNAWKRVATTSDILGHNRHRALGQLTTSRGERG